MSTNLSSPPPKTKQFSTIPIIHELTCVYIILHNAIRDFPKLEKYSLGASIEKTLLDCIKQTFFSTVVPPSARKFESIALASAQFDTLKLYVRIAIDIHCLEENIYLKLLPHLGSIGTMMGGWLKEAQKTSGQIQNRNQT